MKLDRIYSLINNKGILKEVSFEFNPGNLYYIIVENENVGDSLFDVIGLVSPIMEGSFIINDLDVSGLSYKEKAKIRRENIGFIFKNIFSSAFFHFFKYFGSASFIKITDRHNFFCRQYSAHTLHHPFAIILPYFRKSVYYIYGKTPPRRRFFP